MIETKIRIGEKRFNDNKVFPRGFGKSGDFTLEEDFLLTTYGQTLLALESGDIKPLNAEEKHFLKVIKNPVKAKTKLERTWLKYIRLARNRRNFYTLTSNIKHQQNFTDNLVGSITNNDNSLSENHLEAAYE
ncbi:DUF413 domain-containing protein [Vibrio sp. TH_r3]|uniref:DUF413 domain-containing protein n=1 Tax=Vibrio sp. TH_r3 TaxID=3082084 RepID=UPI00295525E0|nr:DUF413 domain-containing protein [Vibrio sp. TH_r3]MDV7103810.1 DUF413 domain-containing protein [Vibrio sp. TH_r3]